MLRFRKEFGPVARLGADDAPAVSVWSPDSDEPRRFKASMGEQADTLSISPDGRTIAVGSNVDDAIWILNVADGSLAGKLEIDD